MAGRMPGKNYIDDNSLQGAAVNERMKYPKRSDERRTLNQIVHANDRGKQTIPNNPYSGPNNKTSQARDDFNKIVNKRK